MFTQSCYFLHNNKQSPLTGRPTIGLVQHHNFSLLASCNYDNIGLSKICGDLRLNPASEKGNLCRKHNSTKSNVNKPIIVNKPSTRVDCNAVAQNWHLTNMKQQTDCRSVLGLASLPFKPSFLVGGFVGSKSQVGRQWTFQVNMWDIIRELGILDLVKNSSNISDRNNYAHNNSTMESEQRPNGKTLNCTADRLNNKVGEEKETQGQVLKKQSYADVAKTNLFKVSSLGPCTHLPDQPVKKLSSANSSYTLLRPESGKPTVCEMKPIEEVVPSEDHFLKDLTSFMKDGENDQSGDTFATSEALPKSILKTTPKKLNKLVEDVGSTSSPELPDVSCVLSRDRIVSQCSDDSECSFIVFEQSEYDNGSVNNDEVEDIDDEGSSSCDESDDDGSQTSEDHTVHSLLSESQQQRHLPLVKKRVRFAEGEDLVQVWEVEDTQSAGRSEWELHALDCWRFKQRIREAEASLQGVLEPAHRAHIYRQRFAE